MGFISAGFLNATGMLKMQDRDCCAVHFANASNPVAALFHVCMASSLAAHDLKQKSDFHALLENSLTMTLS